MSIIYYVLAHLTFEFIGVGDDIFDRVVFGYEFGSGLLPYSMNAWDVIRSVAPETEYVDDLFRTFDSEFLAHFFYSEYFRRLAAFGRFIYEDILTYELTEVFIRCHHKSREPFFLSFFRKSTNNIVGLISRFFKDRDIKSLDNFFDIRHRDLDVGRCLLAVSLIFRKVFGSSYRFAEIESHADMSRILVFQHFV